MATNKNQHFVPRCYLRAFTFNAENKAINLFNIDRLKFIEKAPVKHQCSRNNFYGQDPLLENALQFTEGAYGSPVHEIFQNGYKLDKLHGDILRRFWLLQFHRTEAASRRSVQITAETQDIIGLTGEEFNLSIKDAVIESLIAYSENIKIVDDLKICLFKNKTEAPFITSDDPAVLSNRWHLNDKRTKYRSFGLRASGILIFLPISPTILCVGYDRDVYTIPNKNGWVNITNVNDVIALNEHQFLNCKANIYVRESTHYDFVQESYSLIKSNRPKQRHRINYAVLDCVDGGYKRYKVTDPKSAGGLKESLLHIETIHAKPNHWPRQIRWREKGAVFSNGTRIGYLRRAFLASQNSNDFRKEPIKQKA